MRKDIEGYSNYFCDSKGRLYTRNWKNHSITKQMKPAHDKKGYLRTVMVDDLGLRKTVKLHRVIAKAFIPNPENKPQVNHINGIKDDNRVENLEWCTPKENTKHAIDNGLFIYATPETSKNITPKKGELNGQSKLTKKDVLDIRSKFKPRIYTRKILALEYNVSEATIKDVVLMKSWKHI